MHQHLETIVHLRCSRTYQSKMKSQMAPAGHRISKILRIQNIQELYLIRFQIAKCQVTE